MARVRFGQDGSYFDAAGNEVVERAAQAPETEDQPSLTREELEGMHWRKLKSLVNAMDAEYTNRDEAIELLLLNG